MKADLVNEISFNKIAELIEYHRGNFVDKYNYLYNLYKGEHEILNRVVGENKPNNKLVGDFYGKLVDTEIGYFLGVPIVFNSLEEKALDELGNIMIENEFDEMIMEVGKEASIKGKSFIMLYQDEEALTKLCRLSPENVVTVESKKGRGEIGVAFRFYDEVLDDDSVVTYVEGYDRENVYYFILKDGILLPDNRYKVNPEAHIFGQVPIIKILNNEEEMGSFEKCISLVEAYDKLLSDTSNEHEAYRNAYLVLKNLTMDTEAQAKLKESGVLELFDDGEAYFLNKPILDGAINSHLDRLNNDIHKFSDIPDLSDENFAGNLSGVAIRFKLLGLENKCITKERKMVKGIRKMIRALNKVLEVKVGEIIDVSKLNIVFTRNLPNNLSEIVDSVVKLNGIVDKETLLSLLPFIESPKEVIEKLEAEADTYSNDLKRYEDMEFNNTSSEGEEYIPNEEGIEEE